MDSTSVLCGHPLSEVNAWVSAAIDQQGQSTASLERALAQPRGWLRSRLSPTIGLTFRTIDLIEIGRLLNLTVPDDVHEALREALGNSEAMTCSGLRRPSQATLLAAMSAEREMEVLLAAAAAGRTSAERDLEWARRRFGIGQAGPESLLTLANQAGVSKERVRQVECSVLQRTRSAVVGRSLPKLTSVRDRVAAASGETSSVFERSLEPILGRVRLASALRFLEIIDPDI